MFLGGLTRRAFLVAMGTVAGTVALASSPLSALAEPTSADVQAQADEAASKLSDYKNRYDEVADNYYQALVAHDDAVAAMDDAQSRIDDAQAQTAVLQKHLGTRAISMYKSGASTIIDVLFGSASFQQFASNWDFLQNMNTADADNIEQLRVAKQQLTDAETEYSEQEQVAEERLEAATQLKSDAEAILAQYQTEYDSLSAEAAVLAQQQVAAEAAANVRKGDVSYSGYVPPVDGSAASIIVSAAYYCLSLHPTYRLGGEDPNDTMDCSGLTKWCYAQAGISLSHYTESQLGELHCIPLSQAQPGDILYRYWHVAIYVGGGQYIQASGDGIPMNLSSNMGGWECALRY